jgi:hypothetical protein
MTGRPSIRTPEMVDEILKRIAEGETLASICREDGMPGRTAFYEWLAEDRELSERFARARDVGFDAIADEALGIADDGARDYTAEEGRIVVDHDHIARSRLRVDTRLKLLAKWAPRKYGERLELAGDPERPLQSASDEQIEARIKELLAKGTL